MPQPEYLRQAYPASHGQQPALGQSAPQQPALNQSALNESDLHQSDPPQPAVPQHAAPRRFPPERQRPQGSKRAGPIIAVVSGVALVVLLIIAGVVAAAALSASLAPERAVAAYLHALENGDATKALSISGVHPASADLLLTDAAYRAATDRISRFAIGTTAINGDTAAVTVQLAQGARRYTQTFTLDKAGANLLFFPIWRLEPVRLGAVLVRVNGPSDAAVIVAGITAPRQAAVELAAFPGTYRVTAASTSQWYTLNDASAAVIGFGTAGSKPVTVDATLTEHGVGAATDAVDNYLDGCAASTAFLPPNCPFGATGQDPAYTYTNVKWTIDPRPVFKIGAWRDGGWSVTTTTPGAATFTSDISNAKGHGTSRTDPIPVRVSGSITKIDDSGATFMTGVVNPATA